MTDTSIVTTAPNYAPDFVHELFWNQISSVLGEQLQRLQPSMGTVSGATGTYLLVIPDNSPLNPQGLPVARKMAHPGGRRYRIGDRVLYGPVKGQPVVYAGITTSTGAAGEGVVSQADIDATFATTLIGFTTSINSIFNRLDGIDTRIGQVQGIATAAQTTADNAKTRADNAFTNAASAQTTANNAQSAATAADAHAQNVYNLLATPASNGQQALDRLQTNINLRMNTVCLKACGCNSCNCGTCASGVGV